MRKYKLVVAGGTFDHLHKGHEQFFHFMLEVSDKVLLGITSDEFSRKKRLISVQPFEDRKKAVLTFLKRIHAENRVTISVIDSVHPPIEWQKLPIEAIVVTSDTKDGASTINHKRAKYRLPILPIEVIPLVNAEDGLPIASRRVRSGEIATDGRMYLPTASIAKTYYLPDNLRSFLKNPFGTLIIDNKFAYSYLPMDEVITVGDVATKTFLERGLTPRIAIVDLIVERKKTYESYKDIGFLGEEVVLKAKNPPGQITSGLLNAIAKAFSLQTNKHVVIAVDGEEDLAVIPCVLKAPLGAYIFYGQPGVGLVKVVVSREQKEILFDLFNRLKTNKD